MMDFDQQESLLQERRKRYAQQLQGAQNAPQGRMVGNVYVAPNFLEYAAQALRGVGAMRGEQAAEQELKSLQGQRAEGTRKALAEFLRQSQGTPVNAPADGMGPVIPAQAPNMQGAYAALLNAPDAGLRQAGTQGMLSMALPKPTKWEKVELPTPEGGRRVGFVDINAANPIETFREGGTENPAMSVGPAGQAYNPRALTPGAVLADPNKPFTIGPDGRPVANQAFQGYELDKATRSAPRVSVDARNFNTQESEQSKTYGKGLGEIRTAITQAGYDAPGKLARLERMDQLLAGIDGGAAAPALADIASFANSLGIKIDPKLGNKQAAEALAREMAATLRQPGTGPMTDKDFENFLRQVPSLSKTAQGRQEIMTTMRAAIERDQRASKYAREYARQNNGVIDDNFFDSLADFYAKNPVVTPKMPPTNARGNAFSDPGKEQRYQEWLRTQGAK